MIFFFDLSNSNMSEQRPLVMCGPSGIGKTTLKNMLVEKYKVSFGFSVSHTTRKPREGEVDGVDYHFVTKDKILKMIQDGQFVEYANVHKNIYGTSIQAVRSVMKQNKICILDIDIQGVKSILNGPAHKELRPYYLFVQPRNFDSRLRKRQTDSEEQIQIRLKTAKNEISASKSMPFDKFLTNDVLEKAYTEYETFMVERYPILNNNNISSSSSSSSNNNSNNNNRNQVRRLGLGIAVLYCGMKYFTSRV